MYCSVAVILSVSPRARYPRSFTPLVRNESTMVLISFCVAEIAILVVSIILTRSRSDCLYSAASFSETERSTFNWVSLAVRVSTCFCSAVCIAVANGVVASLADARSFLAAWSWADTTFNSASMFLTMSAALLAFSLSASRFLLAAAITASRSLTLSARTFLISASFLPTAFSSAICASVSFRFWIKLGRASALER